MTIYYSGDEALSQVDRALIEQSLAEVLSVEGLDQDGEISILLVSSEEMHELNHSYRAVDRTTDVLSFPQVESIEEAKSLNYLFLGDIVINLEQVKLQAEEFGHSQARELSYLTVHSLYHLLGFDHEIEADKTKMRAKEDFIMARLEEK